MTNKKPGPNREIHVYLPTMRLYVLPQIRDIFEDHFKDTDMPKAKSFERWGIQGIAKDREVSPFIQTRLLLEGGGIADDELEQLKNLIEELMGK